MKITKLNPDDCGVGFFYRRSSTSSVLYIRVYELEGLHLDGLPPQYLITRYHPGAGWHYKCSVNLIDLPK